jgi:hypothetical protein
VVGKALLVAAALFAALAPAAGAAAPDPCPGDPIEPDQVITGEFGRELVKSYVFLPFEVPAGTTAVRVKYCYDQPDLNPQLKHTIDLGLYQPRGVTAVPWGPDQFRGWGGSSHPDVTVSPEGFSTEEQYRERPKGHVPGKTTRGFRPGPIPAGPWAVELGVAAVIEEGDSDGTVAWRVEIDLSDDPAFADEPYTPTAYSTKPVKRRRGWYRGDLHVHGEHSALGDATMTELFDFAFSPRPEGAGLDFLTLTDYVSGSSWSEIGRFQRAYPSKLIVGSAEIITYRGHLNSHANSTNMDYRTGPLYERAPDGSVREVRAATPPRLTFDRIHSAGGFAQINHPTIFPSNVPGFESLCRGCPWDYTDEQTDYRKVDTWEVHTGPAGQTDPPTANPFTLTAIQRWDELRADGHRITGVAVSDSHNAGRTPGGITQSPIGQGTTVVYADQLSEEGIQRALELGHAFVKLWASDDPDLRLDAVTEDGVKAMMGDPLRATSAKFTARVLNGRKGGESRRLIVLRNGERFASRAVTSNDFTYRFDAGRAGDYRLQLERGNAVDGLTNPITLGARPLAIRARVSPKRARAGRRTRFTFDVRRRAQDRETPLAGAVVSLAGKRARTNATGRARIAVRIRKPGRYRATVTKPGLKRVRLVVRVTRGG